MKELVNKLAKNNIVENDKNDNDLSDLKDIF